MSLALPSKPPADFTPSHALTHIPPFDNAIDNNPCGKPIVATSSPLLIDQSAHSLCLPHLMAKLGQGNPTLVAPFLFSP